MNEKLKELSGLLRDSKTWMEHVCKECDGADVQNARLDLAARIVADLRATLPSAGAETPADVKIMTQQAALRSKYPATDRG